jgi:ribosomal protein L35
VLLAIVLKYSKDGMKRFSITLTELASSHCFRNHCDNEENSSERLRKASNSSAEAVAVEACLLKADPT